MEEPRARRVVVTGGTGALGDAVVAAFVEAGWTCHVPVHGAAPASRSSDPWAPGIDLTDEAAVAAFYASLPSLSASVHVAGGFDAKPIVETSRGDLGGMLDVNLVTAFLCCREAVRKLTE